jgi:ATP-binding cassette, subfamily B, bacterial PglK
LADLNELNLSSRRVLLRSLGLLERRDRRNILVVAFVQIFLSGLDLLGVAVIGVIGALAANGIAQKSPGDRASAFLGFVGLENASLQEQVGVLSLIAVLVFIAKTLVTLFISRRILFYLSRVAARMSAQLVSRLLSSQLVTLQQKTVQEQMFAVTSGVATITVGIIGIIVTLISDIALMIILTAGLFVVEPLIAVINLIAFSLVGLALHKGMHMRALRLGDKQTAFSITSNQRIFEVLTSYREAFVKNRRGYYAKTIGDERMKIAETSAELGFMPQISKYVIEATVIVIAVLVCGAQFLISDVTRAVGVLAVFMAASLRIAPAVLRLQQSFVSIRSSIGSAKPTLELIESLGKDNVAVEVDPKPRTEHFGFNGDIRINNLSFKYPQSERLVISDFSLDIAEGDVVAVVGPSGAGKTTLIDLILGILEPQKGTIEISGVSPLEAIRKWSGAIAYVPQDVMIMNGTIKQNVCMGFDENKVEDELVWNSLALSHLDTFVSGLPLKIDTQVGDRGAKISGGQRQRLGIARALVTRPALLVLDEATSALDGETEAGIAESIQSMRGKTTVIMIAHRLSTVRGADKVVYMSDGKLIACGSFDYVRNLVPDFDKQAQLMGL